MKIVIAITVLAGILFINSIVHINNVLAQTSYKKYGYVAILPNILNNSREVVAVKGSIYPYAQSPSSSHVDNMVYVAHPYGDISVGAGHMNFGSNNSWYMMYFDGGTIENAHMIIYTQPSQPTTTYTAEVVKINSKTYAIKINDVERKRWSCSSTCPTPTIAGAVSWGTNTNSGFTVNGYLFNLQLKRPSDRDYQDFHSVANLRKCYEEPNDLGFEFPLPNNSINAILIDATTKHECTGDVSDAWLYNGGKGG